jgi:hypothetical protein
VISILLLSGRLTTNLVLISVKLIYFFRKSKRDANTFSRFCILTDDRYEKFTKKSFLIFIFSKSRSEDFKFVTIFVRFSNESSFKNVLSYLWAFFIIYRTAK